jgi:hypothetical protein
MLRKNTAIGLSTLLVSSPVFAALDLTTLQTDMTTAITTLTALVATIGLAIVSYYLSIWGWKKVKPLFGL